MADKGDTASVNHTDVSSLAAVFGGSSGNQSAVEFLMSVRAAERMRIADHLHDTACQLLAILQLTLGRLRRQGIDDREATIVECEEMVSRIGRQLREITDLDL